MMLILTILTALSAGPEPGEAPKGKLVIVGGGATTEEIRLRVLKEAGGAKAKVVVVPHASSDPNAGPALAQRWRETGAEQVAVLDLADPKAAIAAIETADLIWMRGGSQVRLMRALDTPGISGAIRERYRQGATIGGTSAGAAVMSAIMIAGETGQRGSRPEDRQPRLAPGLGLWPEVIVDQHFLRRKRISRLTKAVLAQPDLLGVGIDESTAVIVSGRRFEVLGNSEVVVLDGRKAAPKPADVVKPAVDDGAASANGDGGGSGAETADVQPTQHTLKTGMAFDLDKGLIQ